MEMFRHNNESMQQETSLIPVSEYRVHQEFRVHGSEKQGSHLKRNGGNGVGIDDAPRIWVVKSILQVETRSGKGREERARQKGTFVCSDAMKSIPQGLKAGGV